MDRLELLQTYRAVRAQTTFLADRLAPEDCTAQSMPDASPVKWHLAHTSWFFETFVLTEGPIEHRPFDPAYAYLFNSYYNAIGEQYPRARRGLITRPGLDEVLRFRAHVDTGMERLLHECEDQSLASLAPVIELGINHEEQHQELILTDLKHLLAQNPLAPRYADAPPPEISQPTPLGFVSFAGGLVEVGDANEGGFAFDNERPRHKVWLEPFSVANRLSTCGEYLEFMQDGGYERPELWLSEGWNLCHSRGWTAPLYWKRRDDGWRHFTLTGMRRVDLNEPICHLSLFEADAFARWSGARLPTEAEWECSAVAQGHGEHFAPSPALHPRALRRISPGGQTAGPGEVAGDTLHQMFGDAWEWTASAYLGYPGYRPVEGALGEYNGKFMANQFVLRGGSIATPRRHFRPTYRNFFPADARWQFTGVRLGR
ncbi:MAG: ergothioneine biosynthesis protein EgtB [Candidatus Eisenbacteria bacterium]|nr:ergothioneine biosynthesis protein EgtB [Candidatus Eisenbacteria bacterium]